MHPSSVQGRVNSVASRPLHPETRSLLAASSLRLECWLPEDTACWTCRGDQLVLDHHPQGLHSKPLSQRLTRVAIMPAQAPAARRLDTCSLPSLSAQRRLSISYDASWMELYGMTFSTCGRLHIEGLCCVRHEKLMKLMKQSSTRLCCKLCRL